MAPIQMYNFRSLGGRGALVHRRHADVSGSLYLKQCVSCACLFQNVEMCSTSARFRNLFFRVIFLASFFNVFYGKLWMQLIQLGLFCLRIQFPQLRGPALLYLVLKQAEVQVHTLYKSPHGNHWEPFHMREHQCIPNGNITSCYSFSL